VNRKAKQEAKAKEAKAKEEAKARVRSHTGRYPNIRNMPEIE